MEPHLTMTVRPLQAGPLWSVLSTTSWMVAENGSQRRRLVPAPHPRFFYSEHYRVHAYWARSRLPCCARGYLLAAVSRVPAEGEVPPSDQHADPQFPTYCARKR